MVELLTSKEMQDLDRKTIEDIGIPGIVLMEHAGYRSASLIRKLFLPSTKVLVVCGKGNNGGDGFVVARWLHHWNYEVEVSLIGNPESMKEDCKTNFKIAKEILGDRLVVLPDLRKIGEQIERSDIIIDAILGTGLVKKTEGFYKEVIDLINRNKERKRIIAIDIPSGINADTGNVPGSAIYADYTVTFGRLKRALFIYPAKKHAGEVFLVDIGIPTFLRNESKVFLVEEDDVMKLFKKRDPMAHKGHFGHLMVITGSPGKTGAGMMAGTSAIRMGVGLATLIVPKSLNKVYESGTLEVMTEPVDDTDGFINKRAIDKILKILERATAIAIGPGLGQHEETVTVVREVIRNAKVPVVVDADGINLLTKCIDVLKDKSIDVILTPHPGEFIRLTGESKERVLNERL
ncbi:MAG: NAD(P)H-hydrate epimerase, partial [Thermosulfidibacteraceae bacterium]